MAEQRPTVCRIVLYRLSEDDATAVNRRRNIDPSTGNRVQAGETYPMVITRVWGDQPDSAVNGQVLLDGGDTLWATSVLFGEGPRHFTWPPRV